MSDVLDRVKKIVVEHLSVEKAQFQIVRLLLMI